MTATIQIGNRTIGPGHPCFIVAEAGVNHNGDVAMALRLIDAAAAAGADAVKFQTFNPDLLVAPEADKAEYQVRSTGVAESQLEMLRRLALPDSAYAELIRRAASHGLVFLSTAFDEESADFLERLDIPAFKVSSEDVINPPFLVHLARKQRPILLSTGMATLAEVSAAVESIRSAGDPPLALFHCVSDYPAAAADCNLRAMATMRDVFRVPTGWSDHTMGVDIAVAAAVLGADLLEKHFTLDRTLPGPDQAASLEPGELQLMVESVYRARSALGDGVKRPRGPEIEVAVSGRKSLHWRRSLPTGAMVSAADLIALRPGTGIFPTRLDVLIGRRLARAVDAGKLVRADDFEGELS